MLSKSLSFFRLYFITNFFIFSQVFEIDFYFGIADFWVSDVDFLIIVYIAIDKNQKEVSAKYLICESDKPEDYRFWPANE